MSTFRAAGFVLAGVALLRWIARERVEIGREAVIAAGCMLIVVATRGRTWSVAVALAAALTSPAIPSKTAALPLVVAMVFFFISIFVEPGDEEAGFVTITLDNIGIAVTGLMLMLFAWSGVTARALPSFWRSEPAHSRIPLNWALAPGQVVAIDMPPGTEALIVSAANGLQLRRGTLIGTIEPGHVPIRIGDASDWGYARRDQYWRSRNVLPKRPAGVIRGYGYDAWIDGAGRIALGKKAKQIHMIASPALPREVRLQVEAIELGRTQ